MFGMLFELLWDLQDNSLYTVIVQFSSFTCLMIALNGHVKEFRATVDIKHDLQYEEVVVESEGIYFRGC